MKREVTKIQAKLASALTLENPDDVQNRSLHFKLQQEFSEDEKLSSAATKAESIHRLLHRQEPLRESSEEIFH